jgi:hypothetical protein
MHRWAVVLCAVALATAGCGGGGEQGDGPTKLTAAEVAHTKVVHLDTRRAARLGDDDSLEALGRDIPTEARRARALCRDGAAAGPTFRALRSECMEAVVVGQRVSRALISGARCDEVACSIRFLRRLAIEFARIDRLTQAYARKTERLRVSRACRTILVGSGETRAATRRLVGEIEAALDAARGYRDAPEGTAQEREAEQSYDRTYERWFATFTDYSRLAERDLRVTASACSQSPG